MLYLPQLSGLKLRRLTEPRLYAFIEPIIQPSYLQLAIQEFFLPMFQELLKMAQRLLKGGSLVVRLNDPESAKLTQRLT